MTVFLIIYGVLNALVLTLYALNFCTTKIPGLDEICAKLKINNPILRAILKGLFCIVFLPATVLYIVCVACIAAIIAIAVIHLDINNHITEEGDI